MRAIGLLLAIGCTACPSQSSGHKTSGPPETAAVTPANQPKKAITLKTGADQLEAYLPMLRHKRVGLVVNHTSLINKTHLLDTLLARNITVDKILVPEHGFRGEAEAGANVKSSVDARTNIPIISLYGNNKKPKPEDLQGLDVLVFDMQDVGTRFYTYISTMHYVMEACAENDKHLIVLDRPNPNGSYFDGPVLEPEHKSFVGMHPIPIVHGLTIGELAGMINGEKWLKNGVTCPLTVIRMQNYDHDMPYALPVKPSPNLPNALSVALYPSLCLFEGAKVSIGRGTHTPYQVLGSPYYPDTSFYFIPKPIPGMATKPEFEGQKCYGIDFTKNPIEYKLTLQPLIHFYEQTKNKVDFFNSFFARLAGTKKLQQQIEAGLSEEEIRKSWQPELQKYSHMRLKYLLYPD